MVAKIFQDAMRAFYVLIFILVLASCQDKNVLSIDLESVSKTHLNGETLGNIELQNPRKIYFLNGTIALFDKASTNGFLWFIDPENGELIKRYGVEGRGPKEFLNPNIFQHDDSVLIQTIDGRTFLVDTSCTPKEILKKDKSTIRVGCNYIGLFSDSTFVVSSPSTEDRINFVNIKGTKQYNKYPFKVPKNLQMLKETIFDASYDISDSRQSLVVANRYYPIIEIINFKTLETNVFQIIDNGIKNSYDIQNGVAYFNDPVLKYTKCFAGKKGIYCLYHNATEEDAMDTLPEIHLISYDGQMMQRYALDYIIYDFTLSEDEDMIYALGMSREFLPEIRVYNLS